MVKTAVLLYVQCHTDISGDPEEHFRRLYIGNCESTMVLLLYMLSTCRRPSGESLTAPSEYDQALAEILENIGAGSLLRAILTAMKYAKFMDKLAFARIRDCLFACSEIYIESGDASLREVYLQLPVLQAIEVLLMPVSVTDDDLDAEKSVLEAYRNACTHMS